MAHSLGEIGWRRAIRVRSLHALLTHPVLWAGMAIAIGWRLGLLAHQFQLRYFKLIIAMLFGFAVLRLPTHWGVGIFLALFSFPTYTWLGDTNFLFPILLLVVWLGRAALGIDPLPRRTWLDGAIALYVISLLVSCLNLDSTEEIGLAWIRMRHLLAPIALYYVLVNLAREERRLLLITEVFLFGTTIVFFSVFAQRYLPGWSWLPTGYLSASGGQTLFQTQEGAVRLGGVYTHALLSDATAVCFILRIHLAMFYQRRPWLKAYHWIFALLSLFVLSMTGNRGGMLVLAGGVVYYFWIFRRQFRPAQVALGVLIGLVALVAAEYMLFEFQGEGSLLGRTLRTHFVRGIPETRVHAWNYIAGKLAESPIIGHGPVYRIGPSFQEGNEFWPHNGYFFYLYLTGSFGLLAFLFLAWRVLRRSWVGQGLTFHGAAGSRSLAAVYHVAALQMLAGQLRTDHQRQDVYVVLIWIIFSLAIYSREVWEQQRLARPGRKPALPAGPGWIRDASGRLPAPPPPGSETSPSPAASASPPPAPPEAPVSRWPLR